MNTPQPPRKAKPPKQLSTPPQKRSKRSSPAPSGLSLHPEPRNEQERRQREDAERRERALLWTDERPFSRWKS